VALGIPLVWTGTHRLHELRDDIWVGMRIPATEVPERAEAIREALVGAGATVVEAEEHPDDALLAVHAPELLAFLSNAWDEWQRAGMLEDPGQDRVVSYVFPHPDLMSGRPPREPTAVSARTGFYCYDTMTAIGPGTWEAARAAADCALTAADRVHAGDAIAYACCRPPGHHVTRACYGGSCYLNNAAIAAQRLRSGGAGRVAIVDIDAHHGNGTQQLFYEEEAVLTCSVHVDPGAGWFPHFLGFTDEIGAGDAEGTNVNLAVPPRTGDDGWLAAVREAVAAVRAHGAEALVVALGVDAAGDDPESPLLVSEDGYREAGRAFGELGLPTVIVQEGGYDLASLGGLVLAALEGVEEGSRRSRA
jgi:acetoin utilization deacetylase AcuC-like enzyme